MAGFFKQDLNITTLNTTGDVGIGTVEPGAQLEIQDDTTSSANTGGSLRLSANDGAAMGDSHRLGVIEFTGAEDTSNTQIVGARIEALTDAAWTNVENGCSLYFYTTDGNNSQTNVLKIDSNKKSTFNGVVDVTDTTDSSDATGDTGALRVEGGASIAKKLFVGENLTVTGDLTVNGTTTTVSTTNTVVSDKLLELANGTSGTPSGDAGIIIERGSSNNAAIIWDESADTFVVGTTTATGSSTGDLSVTDAAFQAAAITASGDISTTGEVKTAKVSFTDGDDAITIADGGGITANTSLTLASGATVTAINDEDNMSSNSATALATQQSIKAYVDSQTSGSGNMDNWILEDDDGTEVTVSNGKEVKFIGSGITTNFTDTSNGTDADPFDLTFTVDAAQTGITSVLNNNLVVGYGSSDANINFATDNEINFDIDGTAQIVLKDGVLEPVTDADVDLGSSGKQFKDGFFHGTLEADAITVNGSALAASATTDTTNASNIASGTLNASRMAVSQTAINSVKNTSLVVGRDADNLIDFATNDEIKLRVAGADTTKITNANSGDVVIDVLTADKNFTIKGTDDSSAITALDIDMAAAGAATFNSTVTATGFIIGSASVSEANLEILDGANVTTTELNLLDGGANVGSSITIADSDGFIVNDGGTMKTIPASDIKTYAGGGGATLDLNLILHTQVFGR